MDENYFLDNKKHNLYKLDKEGFLYQYSFFDHSWLNVTCKEEITVLWDEISKEKAIALMINYYVNYSKEQYLEKIGKTFRKYFTFDKNISFYKFGKWICAVDDNGLNYKCEKNVMTPLSHDMVDRAWKEIPCESLFDELDKKNGRYSLKDMELKLDTNNTLHAFPHDKSHFIFTKRSLELNILEDEDDIEYSSSDASSYLRSIKEKYKSEISYEEKEELNKLNFYIGNIAYKYDEKHTDKCGREFLYYVNQWGKVVAIDENNNEFILRRSSLSHIKSGTITEENGWKRLSNTLAYSYVMFSYTKKSGANKNKITPYDLVLFKNKNKVYFGYSEDNKYYQLLNDGLFHEIDESCFTELKKQNSKEANYKEVVLKIVNLKYEYSLVPYFEYCKRRLKIKNVMLGDKITFYTDLSSIHKNVYAKDELGNELKCDKYKMSPVPKGTIKSDTFKTIEGRELYKLLEIVVLIPDFDLE